MKGIIICTNEYSVKFSRKFTEEWLYRQNKDIPDCQDEIDAIDINPDDPIAIEIFEEYGEKWSAFEDDITHHRHELELVELPDDVYEVVDVYQHNCGQELRIDWRHAFLKMIKIGNENDKIKFSNLVMKYDKFFEEKFAD